MSTLAKPHPLEQIAPLVERANLGIGNSALQHPEAAVGMNVLHAARPEHFLGTLNRARDLIGRFCFGLLDVDHTQAKTDFRVEVAKHFEHIYRTVRAFHHHVVDVQGIEVFDQALPAALLDALSAVVAEAQVHRRNGLDGIEHKVER